MIPFELIENYDPYFKARVARVFLRASRLRTARRLKELRKKYRDKGTIEEIMDKSFISIRERGFAEAVERAAKLLEMMVLKDMTCDEIAAAIRRMKPGERT